MGGGRCSRGDAVWRIVRRGPPLSPRLQAAAVGSWEWTCRCRLRQQCMASTARTPTCASAAFCFLLGFSIVRLRTPAHAFSGPALPKGQEASKRKAMALRVP